MTHESPNQQPYPPALRSYIARMEEIMQTPGYNHSGVPTQMAIDLMQAGIIDSFAQFEACMRDVGSRVYFLTVPLDFYGGRHPVTHPSGQEGEPEYALFVAVNGAEEAAQMLEHLGITPEENAARLISTGVPTLL